MIFSQRRTISLSFLAQPAIACAILHPAPKLLGFDVVSTDRKVVVVATHVGGTFQNLYRRVARGW